MDTSRKIIHIDMDQFYAAVEQRDNPELRGLPVAVGHDAERGVVATASYEARKFGVHSAQSIQVAKRLCRELVIVPPRFSVYKEVSHQIRDIMSDYTARTSRSLKNRINFLLMFTSINTTSFRVTHYLYCSYPPARLCRFACKELLRV